MGEKNTNAVLAAGGADNERTAGPDRVELRGSQRHTKSSSAIAVRASRSAIVSGRPETVRPPGRHADDAGPARLDHTQRVIGRQSFGQVLSGRAHTGRSWRTCAATSVSVWQTPVARLAGMVVCSWARSERGAGTGPLLKISKLFAQSPLVF